MLLWHLTVAPVPGPKQNFLGSGSGTKKRTFKNYKKTKGDQNVYLKWDSPKKKSAEPLTALSSFLYHTILQATINFFLYCKDPAWFDEKLDVELRDGISNNRSKENQNGMHTESLLSDSKRRIFKKVNICL